MDSVNPAVLYYDILFALSLLLTGVYLFMWRKHYDVHITLVFLLVPIICLGYVMLAHATELNEALNANRIIYLGGCFLQLIVLLVVCNMCDIHLGWTGRILKTLAFTVSTAAFVFVLNPMRSGDFYTHTELEIRDGLALLHKEYGWMHSVFQALVIFYYVLSIDLILYSFVKKNQISRKILGLLFFPESLAVIAFFFGKRIMGRMDLLPAVYVIAQVNYLVIVSRMALYDITDTAIDSLVRNGETGFIAIDAGRHYLGSNETAKEIFPILRKLTVDLSVKRRKSFAETVTPWLDAYEQDRSRNVADYETNEKIFDYITTTEPTIFGSESHVIDKTKYNYEKLRRMYWAEIKYAGNIMYHYKEMKELCRIREANGKYLEIMRYYANLLQTRTGSLSADCDRNRGVYQLLKNERYLLLSENGNVRKMYRQLEKMWSKMYNAYMTEAR